MGGPSGGARRKGGWYWLAWVSEKSCGVCCEGMDFLIEYHGVLAENDIGGIMG